MAQRAAAVTALVLACLLSSGGASPGGARGGAGRSASRPPWEQWDDGVVRLAVRPDLCLTAPDGGRASAPLELRTCGGESRRRQELVADLPRTGPMMLAGACAKAAADADGGAAAASATLEMAACGGEEAAGTGVFEFPTSGHGSIRLAAGSGAGSSRLCLAPLSNEGPIEDGSAVGLLPCHDDDGSHANDQMFLVPRARESDSGGAFLGVNLGGWLILEDWMWPAEMMSKHIKDEHSFIAMHGGPGEQAAREKMREHWDTFLRPEHLDKLRRFGFTHVRIPFGYWLLDPIYEEADGFVSGGEPYLARAVGWLKKRGMRAVLDLHAMPGGQAIHQSFTGRVVQNEGFFVNETEYARGKRAVQALVDLVQKYEADPTTSGVVVGVEILNEPSDYHYKRTTEFYSEMVPIVRKSLPSDRYLIMLSFMCSPHSKSQNWLAERIREDPATWGGVFHDPHLYHLFGDNQDPWTKEQDFCKTCCRDQYILRPEGSAPEVPVIVGEYSLATGFWGWADGDFVRKNLHNYLSLYSKAVAGSFVWSFRIIADPADPMLSLEWSIIDMVEQGYLAPHFGYATDVSDLCPAMGDDLHLRCPSYKNTTVHFATQCQWQQPQMAAASAVAPTQTGPGRRLLGRPPHPPPQVDSPKAPEFVKSAAFSGAAGGTSSTHHDVLLV